ncbi:hypothetical protein, partial [Salmonella sp. zj-f54]|uniref:hypothetical protein n=1 Tax=Salmonella sp. zj-f54 TaxID=2582617 RepID=UPI001F253B8B
MRVQVWGDSLPDSHFLPSVLDKLRITKKIQKTTKYYFNYGNNSTARYGFLYDAYYLVASFSLPAEGGHYDV